jgi:hypothetical protein
MTRRKYDPVVDDMQGPKIPIGLIYVDFSRLRPFRDYGVSAPNSLPIKPAAMEARRIRLQGERA